MSRVRECYSLAGSGRGFGATRASSRGLTFAFGIVDNFVDPPQATFSEGCVTVFGGLISSLSMTLSASLSMILSDLSQYLALDCSQS